MVEFSIVFSLIRVNRLTVTLMALVAFILSAAAVTSCRFIVSQYVDNTVIGLYRTDSGDSSSVCISIDFLRDIGVYGLDKGWKAARAFGVMAPIFGFLGFMLLLLTAFKPRPFLHYASATIMVLAAIMQLCTFSIFSIDYCKDSGTLIGKCTFSQGANEALAAAILYFAAVIFMLFVVGPAKTPMLRFASETQRDEAAHKKTDTAGRTDDDEGADEENVKIIKHFFVPDGQTTPFEAGGVKATKSTSTEAKRETRVYTAGAQVTEESAVYVPSHAHPETAISSLKDPTMDSLEADVELTVDDISETT
jgi:hypothetical protein